MKIQFSYRLLTYRRCGAKTTQVRYFSKLYYKTLSYPNYNYFIFKFFLTWVLFAPQHRYYSQNYLRDEMDQFVDICQH